MNNSIPQKDSTNALIVELARLWFDVIESDCPIDWLKGLTDIDYRHLNRNFLPQPLPVLEFLPQILQQSAQKYLPLVNVLNEARNDLYFGQTYRAKDFGEDFLNQYGWVKLVGPEGYWHSDIVSGGILILGERITYPEHWHDAEELYLPVSGNAEWYLPDSGWRRLSAGTLIHHPSNMKHATRTVGEPLIALYLWRGDNLTQKSCIADKY